MAGHFTTQSYVQAFERIEEACRWLHDMGIDYSPTRLGRYREIWRKLAEHQAAGNLSAFEQSHSFAKWVNAALESAEIVDIYDGLRTATDEALVQRLRDALRGHELYVLDNEDRSGRAFAYELSLAAKCCRAGYPISLNATADVELQVDGAPLFIECKRLKSPRRVQKRIKDGLKQLHHRYVASDHPTLARGVLAVSISKIVNSSLGMLEGSSPSSLSNAASLYVAKFIDTYRHYWQHGIDPRTLGVVVTLAGC